MLHFRCLFVDCTVYSSFIRGKVYKLITVSRNFKFGKMDLSSDDNLEFNTYSSR